MQVLVEKSERGAEGGKENLDIKLGSRAGL